MTDEKTTPKATPKKAPAKVEAKFAVIKTGGKQYVVEAGRFYSFEKLPGAEGDKVVFEEVLLVSEGDKVTIGRPVVEGAKVTGKILEQYKDEKVNVLKYKKRKRIHKAYGHRQPLTKVEISEIK